MPKKQANMSGMFMPVTSHSASGSASGGVGAEEEVDLSAVEETTFRAQILSYRPADKIELRLTIKIG